MKSSWRSALHHIYALRGWPSTLPHTRFSVSAGWTEIRGWITHNLHTTKYREIQNRVLYVPVLYHYTSQNLHNYFKSLPHPYKVGTITFALQFWETEAESGLFFFLPLSQDLNLTPWLLTTLMAGPTSMRHCLLQLRPILSSWETINNSFVHPWPNKQNWKCRLGSA